MARKFKIPAVPKTTPKNIRFPNEVIEKVEEAIRGTDTTFSAFVIAATKWGPGKPGGTGRPGGRVGLVSALSTNPNGGSFSLILR